MKINMKCVYVHFFMTLDATRSIRSSDRCNIFYLFEFSNKKYKYVSSNDANTMMNFNDFVLEYLEKKLLDSVQDQMGKLCFFLSLIIFLQELLQELPQECSFIFLMVFLLYTVTRVTRCRSNAARFNKPKIEIETNVEFDLHFMKKGKKLIRRQSVSSRSIRGNDITNNNQTEIERPNQNGASCLYNEIPIGAKGRKRSQSMFACKPIFDEHDGENQHDVQIKSKAPASQKKNPSTLKSVPEGILVNLSDVDEPNQINIFPQTSSTLGSVFGELAGIDFYVPELLPIDKSKFRSQSSNTSARKPNFVSKMILDRWNDFKISSTGNKENVSININMENDASFGHLHYSGSSDSE